MKNENAQLAGALVGLGGTIYQAMDEIDGFVPCGHPATVVIDGLASLQARLSDEVPLPSGRLYSTETLAEGIAALAAGGVA